MHKLYNAVGIAVHVAFANGGQDIRYTHDNAFLEAGIVDGETTHKQLKAYGFVELPSEGPGGIWHHPLFNSNNPDLLHMIERNADFWKQSGAVPVPARALAQPKKRKAASSPSAASSAGSSSKRAASTGRAVSGRPRPQATAPAAAVALVAGPAPAPAAVPAAVAAAVAPVAAAAAPLTLQEVDSLYERVNALPDMPVQHKMAISKSIFDLRSHLQNH
jgi:hypothetical protein